MGEPFSGGHFISGHEHDVLFYEGSPNQLRNKTSRMALTTKTYDTPKDNITRVTSPEFNLFHLTSPELERLIVGQSVAAAATTTKDSSTINSSDLNVLNLVSPDFEKIFANFHAGEEKRDALSYDLRQGANCHGGGGHERKTVEQQHEMYTKTFVEALQRMQQLNHKDHASRDKVEERHHGMTHGDEKTSTRLIFERPEFLELRAHAKLSESAREQMEAHARHCRNSENCNEGLETIPAAFPLALPPINLQVQEVVKRERKKQKNRVAASKCRKKKLEREAQLEVKVQELKERNIELNTLANALKNQVTDLKQRVMEHIACGCHVTLTMAY